MSKNIHFLVISWNLWIMMHWVHIVKCAKMFSLRSCNLIGGVELSEKRGTMQWKIASSHHMKADSFEILWLGNGFKAFWFSETVFHTSSSCFSPLTYERSESLSFPCNHAVTIWTWWTYTLTWFIRHSGKHNNVSIL